MSSVKTFSLYLGALVIAALVVILVLRPRTVVRTVEVTSPQSEKPSRQKLTPGQSKRAAAKPARKPVKKSNPRIRRATARKSAVPVAAVTDPKADDLDEEQLNAPQKALMKAIQDALDNNDLKTLRKVLDRFQGDDVCTTKKGEVPACMRSKAVEALGWFGKDAAIDLIGYMGDRDESVRQDAVSQFEMALDDSEMSDLERSTIVTAAMRGISDPDVIDSLLNQLSNMRNSVKADAITEIMNTGTDAAKSTLQEQIGFYTDDEVKNVEDVKTWKTQNPDGEDDDETYGGEKKKTADAAANAADTETDANQPSATVKTSTDHANR